MIKLLVIFAALFAVAFAAVRPTCLPEEFRTDRVSYIANKNDTVLEQIWFQMSSQHFRHDYDLQLFINGKVDNTTVSLLFDLSRHLYYHIIYQTGKAPVCTVSPVNGTLEKICLAKNAIERPNQLLGGVLTMKNYVETVGPTNDVHLDILIVSNINVPYRVVSRSAQDGIVLQEYQNFELQVLPLVFLVPNFCPRDPKPVRSAEVPTMAQVLAKHNLRYF